MLTRDDGLLQVGPFFLRTKAVIMSALMTPGPANTMRQTAAAGEWDRP